MSDSLTKDDETGQTIARVCRGVASGQEGDFVLNYISQLEQKAEKRSAKIHQLREALAMAWREIVASGNERSKDYDWPKVRAAVFGALEIKDE